MFTFFTDRDGKYQLGTLKESAFDPLSRTCEFMLKEEAHHMMVGTTGVDRVVERTAQLMAENDADEVAARGAIPLNVIQKYLNFHTRSRWTCSAVRPQQTSPTTTPPGSRAAGMNTGAQMTTSSPTTATWWTR